MDVGAGDQLKADHAADRHRVDLVQVVVGAAVRVAKAVVIRMVGLADDVVGAWSAGKTVEWRGLKGKKGFEPYTAIVRLEMKDTRTASPDRSPTARCSP